MLLQEKYNTSNFVLIKSEIVYNVWVWTSDERGAGTDANVFITLYGKKGKTDEMQIGNATDNFEQGQLDKFKVQVVILLSNLGRLDIRHVHITQNIVFYLSRWNLPMLVHCINFEFDMTTQNHSQIGI